MSEPRSLCSGHGRTLVLYCAQCQLCVCPGCLAGEGHRGHALSCFRDACREQKVEMRKKAKMLKFSLKKLDGIRQHVAKAENDLEAMVARTRESVGRKYLELKELIKQNEQQTFRLIAAQRQAMLQQLHKQVEESLVFKSTVESMELLRQVVEKSSNCYDPTELMDICALRLSFESLESFTGQLGQEMRFDNRRLRVLEESVDLIVRKNKEFLPRPWEYAENLTFDSATAHKNLKVSEDRRKLRYASIPLRVPATRDRFDSTPAVLASQSFSFGKHYWEVEVGGRESWSVGVVYSGRARQGRDAALGLDRRSWVLQQSDGEIQALHNGEGILVRERCARLGVFLDCDKGLLTFYSVDSGHSLHCFKLTFAKPLSPAFSLSQEKDTNWPLTLCTLMPQDNQSPLVFWAASPDQVESDSSCDRSLNSR
ncbi:E3 ubiquitin-protein ligase TRIM39 [Amia ocellicauda]|uniref:E3 ubiquitin-protein ligase TRIM39 n=1 Tax=Amia ocellicauda TaxID=2972642 RepID=UPI0034649160